MKTVILFATLLASTLAQAAPVAPKTLVCNVITNGNGRSWENAFHFEAELKDKETSLPKTVVNSYGATFAISAGAIIFPVEEVNMNSYSLSLHVYLNNGDVEIIAQDLTMGEQLKLTGNLLDAGSTFALKPGAKQVAYGVTCAVKTSKK